MHLNLYIIQFYVVIVCHLDKQSVKAPGLLVMFPVTAHTPVSAWEETSYYNVLC